MTWGSDPDVVVGARGRQWIVTAGVTVHTNARGWTPENRFFRALLMVYAVRLLWGWWRKEVEPNRPTGRRARCINLLVRPDGEDWRVTFKIVFDCPPRVVPSLGQVLGDDIITAAMWEVFDAVMSRFDPRYRYPKW